MQQRLLTLQGISVEHQILQRFQFQQRGDIADVIEGQVQRFELIPTGANLQRIEVGDLILAQVQALQMLQPLQAF